MLSTLTRFIIFEAFSDNLMSSASPQKDASLPCLHGESAHLFERYMNIYTDILLLHHCPELPFPGPPRSRERWWSYHPMG